LRKTLRERLTIKVDIIAPPRAASTVGFIETELIDLTAISLRELRRTRSPELVTARLQARTEGAQEQARAIQDQRE
jgi:hypothetical protein